MSKKFKCAVLACALTGVVAMSAATSACTVKTDHPRAKISISFNEQSYDIEYTLYRNMYPQTVQHFIELADEGFYNGMIVHDYKTNDWTTGAYSYNAGDLEYGAAYTSNAMREYLENNSLEEKYYGLFNGGKLTSSVYKQITYDEKNNEQVSETDALPTLIGEFSDNDHNIEKGALSATYGCLKMMYYDKGKSNQKVAIKNSFGQLMEHDYQYNCATSLFAMQVGSSTSYSASKYCVFAELRNDGARKNFQKLTDAISDYFEGTSYTSSVTTTVDNLDTFAEEGGRDIEVSFTMTSMPLVITSVEITKY